MSWFAHAKAALPTASARAPEFRLFEPAFLGRLERLRIFSRQAVGAQARAGRRSRSIGASLEFADFRDYSPGDDLRGVDWNIYGRLDKLYLKLFEAEGELPVHLLIDSSASMQWDAGGGRVVKMDLARQIAAALVYAGLAGQDRVDARFFSDRLERRAGAGRGKAHFCQMRDFLMFPPERSEATDLAGCMRAFVRETKQRGIVIVLSDFFDAGGYEEAFAQLRHRGFETHVIQVLDQAEISPTFYGDVRLVDAETSHSRELSVNPSVTGAYKRAMETFLRGLQSYCAQRGIGFHRAMTDASCEDFVLRALRGGDFPLLR